MNEKYDLNIQSLWEELTQEHFDKQTFAEQLLHDCGHDGIGVRTSQLLELLSGNECKNFKDMLWVFGEVMHYYSVESIDDPRQYVRAVFVAVTLARGVKLGITEWTQHFEPVCGFFCNGTAACDIYTRGELLRRVVLLSLKEIAPMNPNPSDDTPSP